MPQKNSALVQKVLSLLKISIFIARMKKPVIRKVIMFLKKTRELKKMKQYNYYKEYEFSTSSTPLMEFRRKVKNGRVSFRKMYLSVLFICRCLGMESGGRKEMYCSSLPLIESADGGEMTAAAAAIDLPEAWSEDEGVDERAERFIQRFYEEMKRQRVESNFELAGM